MFREQPKNPPMHLNSASCRTRPRVCALQFMLLPLFLMWLAIGPAPSLAHGGDDHGSGPAAAAGQGQSPRVIANSSDYQFTGIAEGEVLVIYLDRFADNSPVTSARIEMTIGDAALSAVLQKNGTYEVSSPLIKRPGEYAVIANITDGTASDLLVGTLVIPEPPKVVHSLDHTIWTHLAATAPPLKSGSIGLGALLLAVAAAGLLRTSGRRFALFAGVIGIALIAASTAFAHEGHDHGNETAAANGNAPQRLANGTIFLPKPTQRVLEIRTRVLASETAARTSRFQGRVTANPDRSGVVQSTIQGRYSAPPAGVPTVGTRVRAGDLMGTVAPSFVSKEVSDMTQTLGELDQQIALARSKLSRGEQLLRTNVVSTAAVEEMRIQLDGLLKRRSGLLEARVQPEELRAPVDGVITNVRVVSGQVVSMTDQIFQIVDPSSFFVEALMFDYVPTEQMGNATAQLASGQPVKLRFLGRSRSLQQQYSVLKFEVADPTDAIDVGAPVIVVAATGAPVSGLKVPRSAVAQAPNGQMVVFVHKDAELFEPRAVRFEPFEADTVLLLSGVREGEKVVIQNAPLVNQVR